MVGDGKGEAEIDEHGPFALFVVEDVALADVAVDRVFSMERFKGVYSNPNVVLKMAKEEEKTPSTLLVKGVAHGILAAWAQRLYKHMLDNKFDLVANELLTNVAVQTYQILHWLLFFSIKRTNLSNASGSDRRPKLMRK